MTYPCVSCEFLPLYALNTNLVLNDRSVLTTMSVTKYSYCIAINLFQFSKLGALPFLALVSMLVYNIFARLSHQKAIKNIMYCNFLTSFFTCIDVSYP